MRARLLLLLLVAVLSAGCGVRGLQFTNDERVAWVTEERAVLTLPLTVEWELTDFTMTGADGRSVPDGGYVAVFVDRSPQRRAGLLTDLAEDDEVCAEDPSCPDDAWFRDRQVYVVEEGTSLTLAELPDTADDGEAEFHDLTLVLLDGQGRRQGESAFRLTIAVERDA